MLPEVVERFDASVQMLSELGARCEDVVIPHYEIFQTANWVNGASEEGRHLHT